MDASDKAKNIRDKTVYTNIQAQVVLPEVKPSSFTTYEVKQEYTNGKAILDPCSTPG
jgi:hypothetical protein